MSPVFTPVVGAPFGRVSNFGDAGVWHAFSTRSSGFSTGSYRSLNLGWHVGDEPDRVRANRQRLLEATPWIPDRVVVAEQVHGARVAAVGPAEAGAGSLSRHGAVA